MLIPKISLVSVMVLSQDINGILLPFVLLFVLKIINDKSIMGEYTNGFWSNLIAWITIIGIILATIVLIASSFFVFG